MLSPAVKLWFKDRHEGNEVGSPDEFPIVATTYRVTEHWQAGAMTRNLDWLNELMPQVFVEMSEELAEEKGIKNGDRIYVKTARGLLGGAACVTKRLRPFDLNGKIVHQIGVPWHWGYIGKSRGCSANTMTPHIGDANTMIPEYKAFLCNIEKSPWDYDRANPPDDFISGKEVT